MDERPVNKLKIIKLVQNEWKMVSDGVIRERPLNIFVNSKHYATLMCTPFELKELAAGFLFSNGVINSYNDILNIEFSSEDILFVATKNSNTHIGERRDIIVSGCGRGIVDVNMINSENLAEINSCACFCSESIFKLAKEFNNMSELFRETGGVHSCCICDSENIKYFSDDIGRHNAIDKIIGKCIINGIDMKAHMLFTTGRISSDSVIKAAKAGIPAIISHSAPTDLAVSIAMKVNMTVVGFARGNRMNIYCGHERIVIEGR